MELFKTFLEDTSGKHLFNFWLDAERYKESLESEPDDTLREQMTRLFRWACLRSQCINVKLCWLFQCRSSSLFLIAPARQNEQLLRVPLQARF